MSDSTSQGTPGTSPEDREGEQAARWAEIVAQLSDLDHGEPVPFRTWAPAEEPEEHYQPPEPPPLPHLTPSTLAALAACLLGLALLVLPTVLGQSVSGGLSAIGILALVGGAGALVYRLRTKSGQRDPDDGAVV